MNVSFGQDIWFGTDGEGTIFVGTSDGTPSEDADGGIYIEWGQSYLTAYDSAALAEPLWKTTLSEDESSLRWLGLSPAHRHGGYAFFTAPEWVVPLGRQNHAYEMVVSLADGTRPEWAVPGSRSHVIDGVAVVRDVSMHVRGIDLESGEELWAAPPGAWEIVAGDGALYLWSGSKGSLERREPRTGKIRWARETPSVLGSDFYSQPWSMWGADPILRGVDDEATELVRYDAQTGREVMRTTVDAPVDGFSAFVGEGQLIVFASEVVSQGNWGTSIETRTVLGLDPDTGDERWRTRFDEGGVSLFGRRLVTPDRGTGALIFYR